MKRPPLSVVAWLVLALGLSISVAAWQLTRHGEREAARLRAERASDEVANRLHQRMEGYEQLLRSAAALFAASETVSRDEWHSYYMTLQVERNYPGVQALAFARHVPLADLPAFEQRVRGQGFPGFTVRPAGSRAHYTPIDFIEPMDERNKRAFGFDMFSEPRRREAMMRARDGHSMALTRPLRLLQEDNDSPVQTGTLLYYPVYRAGMPLHTVNQRRQALFGYVYCPFRMENLLQSVFGNQLQHMHLQLRDLGQPGGESLFISDSFARKQQARKSQDPLQQRVLEVGGRQWQMLYEPPVTGLERGLPRSTLLLWGGMVFSLLSFGLLLSLMTVRQRALTLAAELSLAHRSSEARMRAIFDSTADAILSVDMQGTILTANQVAEDMFGYRSDELCGQHTHLLTPAADHGWVSQLYEELKYGEWPRDYRRDMFARHRSGRVFPVQVSGTRVTIEGLTQLVMLIRDMSRQQQAEEDLRRADILREALLNHAPLCIISTDLEGRLTAINPAGEQLLGWSPETALGVPVAVLESRSDGEPSLHRLLQQAEREHSAEDEWIFMRRDERRVPVWASVAVLQDSNGIRFGYIGIVQDMTGRRRTEAALQRAREQAEAASQAKSEFLANMSHEIRTPMNAVLGMAHLLGTEPLSRQQQNWLDMLNRNGRALLGILNDILDFSKVEAGRMELIKAPFALSDVIDSVAGQLSLGSETRNLQPSISEPAEDLHLLGDALRLQQTLTNLVDNALKFTEEGEVNVRIQLLWRDNERVRLQFCVRDTGIGMSPAEIERLFQPFSQGDSSMTRRYGGTGLGLVISQRMVELHGSALTVSSKVGEGSSFTFELEYDLQEARHPAAQLEPALQGLRLRVEVQQPAMAESVQAACDALGWRIAADDTEAHVFLREWPSRYEDGLRQLQQWMQQAGGRPLLLIIHARWRERLLQLPQMRQIQGLLLKPLARKALLQTVRDISPALSGRSDAGMPVQQLPGLRVLLAEDNSVNQLITRTVLQQAGAEVDIVENGLQAVEKLRERPRHWHVVLMDAQMPVMDGFSATRIVREQLSPDLPIIAISAGVMEAERERCLSCGMNDFIAKPLDVERLYRVLRQYVPQSVA